MNENKLTGNKLIGDLQKRRRLSETQKQKHTIHKEIQSGMTGGIAL